MYRTTEKHRAVSFPKTVPPQSNILIDKFTTNSMLTTKTYVANHFVFGKGLL